MELMSKNAQAILEDELVSYKSKLVNRAIQYAERDGDSLIREKQIMAAIRDKGNLDMAPMQLYQRRKRSKYLAAATWLLILFLLIWLSISVIYLAKDTQENLAFIVGLTVSVASLFLILLLYVEIRGGKYRGQSASVVSFLDKWNEFESLLRYSYKGPNKGGNVSLTDLIEYYLNNFSDSKESDERTIVSILRMRNNLVHRGINQANKNMLKRNMIEMDVLIDKMKR